MSRREQHFNSGKRMFLDRDDPRQEIQVGLVRLIPLLPPANFNSRHQPGGISEQRKASPVPPVKVGQKHRIDLLGIVTGTALELDFKRIGGFQTGIDNNPSGSRLDQRRGASAVRAGGLILSPRLNAGVAQSDDSPKRMRCTECHSFAFKIVSSTLLFPDTNTDNFKAHFV